MLSDARRKLVYVPTIANPSRPTVLELTAAGTLDISCLVSTDGFSLGSTGEAAITDPPLCATADDSFPGRITYEAGMNFYRWTTDAEDKAWALFQTKGMAGYLVQRIGLPFGDAFVIGQKIMVYQTITGTPMVQSPNGGLEKFRQMFYIQSPGTDERAQVA